MILCKENSEKKKKKKKEKEIESSYYGRRKNLVQKLLRLNLFYVVPFNACLSSSRPLQISRNEWQAVVMRVIQIWSAMLKSSKLFIDRLISHRDLVNPAKMNPD